MLGTGCMLHPQNQTWSIQKLSFTEKSTLFWNTQSHQRMLNDDKLKYQALSKLSCNSGAHSETQTTSEAW